MEELERLDKQIKSIHSPVLAVTEVLSIRDQLEIQAKSMVENLQPINWEKLSDAVNVLDKLAIESVESIALLGGYKWRSEYRKKKFPSDDELVSIFHRNRGLSFGTDYEGIIEILEAYGKRFERNGDEVAPIFSDHLEKIRRIFTLVQERTDPVVNTFGGEHGEITQICFFKRNDNVTYFESWKAHETGDRSFRFSFAYEGGDLKREPWRNYVESHFSGLSNTQYRSPEDEAARRKNLIENWGWTEERLKQLDYESDKNVEEYRDQESGRLFQRFERNGGEIHIVHIYYPVSANSHINDELHHDLIDLIPPELFGDHIDS